MTTKIDDSIEEYGAARVARYIVYMNDDSTARDRSLCSDRVERAAAALRDAIDPPATSIPVPPPPVVRTKALADIVTGERSLRRALATLNEAAAGGDDVAAAWVRHLSHDMEMLSIHRGQIASGKVGVDGVKP